MKETPPGVFSSQHERFRDLERVRGTLSGRLSLMVALSDLETVDIETCMREMAFAREQGLRMTIHSNFERQITAMHAAGLLGPDLLPVHGNPMNDHELDLLAEHGTPISFTPSADIVLLDSGPFGTSLCDPAAHIVFQAGAQDVDTVLVAGEVRKRSGELVGLDVGRVHQLIASSREHILR